MMMCFRGKIPTRFLVECATIPHQTAATKVGGISIAIAIRERQSTEAHCRALFTITEIDTPLSLLLCCCCCLLPAALA